MIIMMKPASLGELNVKKCLHIQFCSAIFQYSVINISISTRHKAFIFYMYTVYVAGNYLVKFDLIPDSHLLDHIWLSKLTPAEKGESKKKYSQKRPIKILLF